MCGCVGVSLKRGTLIGNGMALVCMEVVPSADPEEMPSCWGDTPIFLEADSHLGWHLNLAFCNNHPRLVIDTSLDWAAWEGCGITATFTERLLIKCGKGLVLFIHFIEYF